MTKKSLTKTAAQETVGKWWEEKAATPTAEHKTLQTINFKLGNFDDEKRTFTAIASTELQDRQGDSIEQSGWVLDNFLANPVIPWAHNYSELPVARAIEIGVVNGVLQFTYQAPPEGVYPFADIVWNLYRNQYLFAFSVGFIPLEYDGNWEDGYTYTKCELLEVSAVVVPANPGALALAMKMGDIDSKQAKLLKSKLQSTLNNLDEIIKMSKNIEEDSKSEALTKEDISETVKTAIAEALENINVKTTHTEKIGDYEVTDTVETKDADIDGKSLTDSKEDMHNENMSKTKSSVTLPAEVQDKLGPVVLSMQDTASVMKDHAQVYVLKADTLLEQAESLKSLISTTGDETTDEKDNEDHQGDTDGDGDSEQNDTDMDGKSLKESKTKSEEASEEADDSKDEVNSTDEGQDEGASQEEVEEDKEEVEDSKEESEDESSEAEEVEETEAAEEEQVAEEEAEEETDGDQEVDPDNLTEDQAKEVLEAVNRVIEEETNKE